MNLSQIIWFTKPTTVYKQIINKNPLSLKLFFFFKPKRFYSIWLLLIYYFNIMVELFSIQNKTNSLKKNVTVCDFIFKRCILFRKHWIYPEWMKVVPYFFYLLFLFSFFLFFFLVSLFVKARGCHVALLPFGSLCLERFNRSGR